jgi:serine/threonine protein kinase
MLAGYLPFDEEHDIQLYRKIETGSYVVPNFLSREAKDLIHRMIEVEPSKRISVHEIKNHPWMRERVPLYAHVPSAFTAQHDPPFHLNN